MAGTAASDSLSVRMPIQPAIQPAIQPPIQPQLQRSLRRTQGSLLRKRSNSESALVADQLHSGSESGQLQPVAATAPRRSTRHKPTGVLSRSAAITVETSALQVPSSRREAAPMSPFAGRLLHVATSVDDEPMSSDDEELSVPPTAREALALAVSAVQTGSGVVLKLRDAVDASSLATNGSNGSGEYELATRKVSLVDCIELCKPLFDATGLKPCRGLELGQPVAIICLVACGSDQSQWSVHDFPVEGFEQAVSNPSIFGVTEVELHLSETSATMNYPTGYHMFDHSKTDKRKGKTGRILMSIEFPGLYACARELDDRLGSGNRLVFQFAIDKCHVIASATHCSRGKPVTTDEASFVQPKVEFLNRLDASVNLVFIGKLGSEPFARAVVEFRVAIGWRYPAFVHNTVPTFASRHTEYD
jgi:hypothetical protein